MKRRCSYCFDRYSDHAECLTFLELEHEIIVSVIDVEAQLGIPEAERWEAPPMA